MIEIRTLQDLKQKLKEIKESRQTIAFVPTMGALHEGHIELIKMAKKSADIVLCSIFVNPYQFNQIEDFNNYPNRYSEDKKKLLQHECDILFYPSGLEIFPNQPVNEIDFGFLEVALEGIYRPGHFKGMVAVVYRFFDLIQPNMAFFGEKDYQQLRIVQELVKMKNLPIEIIACPTIRLESGLAMSSRNLRLGLEDQQKASKLFQLLNFCKNNIENYSPPKLATIAREELQKEFVLDYFEIVDQNTLEPIKKWEDSSFPRAFVAASLSGVRLIDNMSLIL